MAHEVSPVLSKVSRHSILPAIEVQLGDDGTLLLILTAADNH